MITCDFEELDKLGLGEDDFLLISETNLHEFQWGEKLKLESETSRIKKMSTGEVSETTSENMSFNAFSPAIDLKDIKLNNLDF